MFGLGYQELMIILIIVLLLFGAQKLPELARGLGPRPCGRSNVAPFGSNGLELQQA